MSIASLATLPEHDPSIMKEGKTWYVFATGKAPGGGQFAVRCSRTLEVMRSCLRHHTSLDS